MDVQNGSKHSGVVVQLYGQNGTFAQKFQITADEDGGFTVASIVSGLLVSVSESGSVTQQAKDTAYVQRWSIVATGDGHFAFVAYDGAHTLGASGVANQGTPLAALTGSSRLASTWNMVLVPLIEDGMYVVAASSNQGCVLDIAAASLRWGGNAQVYGANGTNAQKFYIRNLGGEQYSITNIWSALALDVANGAASVGSNIQQYGWNGTNAQKWQAVWDGVSGVVFKSMLGNFALGVSGVSSGQMRV